VAVALGFVALTLALGIVALRVLDLRVVAWALTLVTLLTSLDKNPAQKLPLPSATNDVRRYQYHSSSSFASARLDCDHWRRQLWGVGARAPLDFQQFLFFYHTLEL